MPTATTDSPIATITTSPCLSTKCAGATSKLVVSWIRGVSHSNAAASAQSTYLAVPPAIPPASTISPVVRLNGASATMAWVTEAEELRVNSPAWTITTSR